MPNPHTSVTHPHLANAWRRSDALDVAIYYGYQLAWLGESLCSSLSLLYPSRARHLWRRLCGACLRHTSRRGGVRLADPGSSRGWPGVGGNNSWAVDYGVTVRRLCRRLESRGIDEPNGQRGSQRASYHVHNISPEFFVYFSWRALY